MDTLPVKRYSTYAEFDAETGFSTRAGFQLSPIQIADTEQFIHWDKLLNRYEVGGGKTVVSSVVSLMKGIEVTIVTCPPILLRPWTRWLNKVSGNVIQYEGTPAERKKMHPAMRTARWIICSHEIYRRDNEVLLSVIQDRNHEVIVDEAQAVKNIKSVLYRKVAGMIYGHNLQMLTATPTNKPEDAFAYIKLKTPDLYRSWSHFENLHIAERDYWKQVTKYANIELLQENLGLQSISRTKKELHGYDNAPLYPDATYALSPEHYSLYCKLIDEQLLELPDGSKIDATIAQRLYHASQQIIVNLDYFSGDPDKRSAAYDLLDTIVEQTECNTPGKTKLIVWTMYKRTSRAIWQYLLGKGIKTVAAYSEVKSQDSFDAFMEDDSVRILVAQPQSAGAGLNPQKVCWASLALETSVVPMYTIQSNGRIDRMGQENKPTIWMARAEGTIQVKLQEQLLTNGDLVARVEGSKKSLRDELLGR